MSDWPTVAVTAAATLIASLGAVFINERFNRRRAVRERADAAYSRLITAVDVFIMRVEVMRGDKSFRDSLADSMLSAMPLIMAGLFSLLPKRWREIGPKPAELAGLLQGPGPRFRFDQSRQASLDALARVIEARTDAELLAPPTVLQRANNLIDACSALADGVNRWTWSWDGAKPSTHLEQEWKAVADARTEYIVAVRQTGGRAGHDLSEH